DLDHDRARGCGRDDPRGRPARPRRPLHADRRRRAEPARTAARPGPARRAARRPDRAPSRHRSVPPRDPDDAPVRVAHRAASEAPGHKFVYSWKMMRTLGVAVLVLLLGARVASSQAPPGGPPVHHGFLDLVPAGHGVLNRTTGNATLTVH